MAFCIFSFEGFCVYSILFSEATSILLAAAIHSLLVFAAVAMLSGGDPEFTRVFLGLFSFSSFLFSFLFTGSERFGFFIGCSLDDALDPDGHTQAKQHLRSSVWNSLGRLSRSTRLTVGCSSSGCASGCSWE